MNLLHVMQGPDSGDPFRTLCKTPITAVDFWVSEKWARVLEVDSGSPRCRTCWDTLRRRAVGAVIPKLGFRWHIAGTDLPIIRDQEETTVLATLSTSYEHRELELMPLIAMAPEFHDLIAEAIEHCDSCRMLPLDSMARCARCTSFLNALRRSRPADPTIPAPTAATVIKDHPPEPCADHGTYLIFSDPDGRSQWQGPFRRIRCAGRSLDVIRPDETDENAWWTLALLLDPSNRWSVLEHEFESFRVEVRSQP